jgi:hypothetical protein
MKCPDEVRFDYIITFNLKLKCMILIRKGAVLWAKDGYNNYSVHIITERN